MRTNNLNRDTDEKYSGGIYDFATEYVYDYLRNVLGYSNETLDTLDVDLMIELVYNAVYDILEEGE